MSWCAFRTSHSTSRCLNVHICKENLQRRAVPGMKGPGWSAWTCPALHTRYSQHNCGCCVVVTGSYFCWEPWLWDESSFPLHPPCPAPEKGSIPMATAAAGPLIRGAGAGSSSHCRRSHSQRRPSFGRKRTLPISALRIPAPALTGKCSGLALWELYGEKNKFP